MVLNNLIVMSVRGHYEAFLNDEFICSGDTYNECYTEALSILKIN